jgi:hypothetical protein
MGMNRKLQSLDLPESFRDADVSWLDEMNIQCKGVKLRLTRGFKVETSNDEVITLFKHPLFVRSYIDHLDGFKVDNMIEVGIWDGGSAIFFWNLLKPKKLCCIELKKKAEKLSNYIEREQLSDRFRVRFGVDQADRERLNTILEEEYPGSALDLVIDDASHLYTPSRATFETLFPRLRPGGLYFLEDWKTNLIFPHHGGAESADFPPFHQLVHELLDVSMRAPDVISAVKCYHNFVVLERGPETIKQREFDIGSYLPKDLEE